MIKRKIETNFYGEEVFFLNEKTGDEYCRIAGGLGWPSGNRPGVAIVLAESRFADLVIKKPHYYVLDEHETFSPTDLLKKCAIFQRQYFVSRFYGDTENKPMMDVLQKLNIGLYITNSPFIDDPNALNSYIAKIREATTPGKKTLHLGNSNLGARLLEIPTEKIKRLTKAQDFPMLTALGGTLAALIAWKHNPNEDREAEALIDEYCFHCDD